MIITLDQHIEELKAAMGFTRPKSPGRIKDLTLNLAEHSRHKTLVRGASRLIVSLDAKHRYRYTVTEDGYTGHQLVSRSDAKAWLRGEECEMYT